MKPEQLNPLMAGQHPMSFQQNLAFSASGANAIALGGTLANMSQNVSNMPSSVQEQPTRVLCLAQVVAPHELSNDEEYEDIFEDMKEECGKYGAISSLVIPRPGPNGEMLPGVGKVFVEYSDLQGSSKAKASLNGRKFGGNVVVALYYPEDKFSNTDFSGQ